MSGLSIASNYEYMDENEIDASLKCVICMQPLQSPVNLSNCHHTFCQECIETWLARSRTCPTCRQRPIRRIRRHNRLLLTPPFAPMNDRIILNQLDRLLVRCLLCKDANIERHHWQNHEKTCVKRTVNSPWHASPPGPLDTCRFQRVRSMVHTLKDELTATQTAYHGLKHSVDELERKVDLLFELVNNEKFLMQHRTK